MNIKIRLESGWMLLNEWNIKFNHKNNKNIKSVIELKKKNSGFLYEARRQTSQIN